MPSTEPSTIYGVVVERLSGHNDRRGWLSEMYRFDEREYQPVMAYISSTNPGVCRGPHEHESQSDFFCFFDSQFILNLWDNREHSPTYQARMTLIVGTEHPVSVLVPPGVVHGYKNVGFRDGLVLNLPDQLYKGFNKAYEVDEIRHENDKDSWFRMDD